MQSRRLKRVGISGTAVAAVMAMVAAGASAGASPAATKAGIVTAVAGGPGYGRALNVAQIPGSFAMGSTGTVYVGDEVGYIRALNPSSADETVVAGSGYLGSTSNGATALSTTFGQEGDSVAVDSYGDQVVAAHGLEVVRVVAAKSGTRFGQKMVAGHVYTVAGISGTPGSSASGLLGTSSELNDPTAVAVDASGNLVIADTDNSEVQVLAAKSGEQYGQDMTAGHLYVVAGDGTSGDTGLGGAATAAELDGPTGVALTANGSIVVSNSSSSEVDIVAEKAGSFYGVSMKAGDIYDVAGDGTTGTTGLGGSATAAELDYPTSVAIGSSGVIVVADTDAHRVVAIPAKAGALFGVTMKVGDLYSVAGNGTEGAAEYRGTGVAAGKAELDEPEGVAFDKAGNLLIGDVGAYWVDVVAAKSATGYGHKLKLNNLSAVAGSGTIASSGYGAPAIEAENNTPVFVATSSTGDIAFADYGLFFEEGTNHAATPKESPDSPISSEVASSRIRLVPDHNETRFGIRLHAGDMYTVAGGGATPGRTVESPAHADTTTAIRAADQRAAATDNGGPARSAALLGPVGVAYDHAGNLVIDEIEGGLVDVVASSSGTWYGVKMKAGHIYVIAGLGTDVGESGVPATDAELSGPSQLAVDKAGNVVVAEESVKDEDGDGLVQVIAEETGTAYGVDVKAGDIYTIAGGGSTTPDPTFDGEAATSVELYVPFALAIDSKGDVAIGGDDKQVWMIDESAGTHFGISMTPGDIYTIAGDPNATSLGNGGSALDADMQPEGLAFTANNSLVISDLAFYEIRLVPSTTGTQFGLSVKANDIYAIVGTGTAGLTLPGVKGVDDPTAWNYGLALTTSGNLLFSNFYNGTIDELSAG